MKTSMPQLSSGSGGFNVRLAISYVLDWIIILATWLVGGLIGLKSPNHHPFSLTDPEISYPYVVKEKVTSGGLVGLAFIIPAAIIVVVCLLAVPGRGASGGVRSLVWKRKLWEWNTAWLGLAAAYAGTFVFTDGLKGLTGKPRPDMLARCLPDYSRIQDFAVGARGNGNDIILVTWQICTQTDRSLIDDGFASFPSGHAAYSFAGLTYLTLFLASKLGVVIPYLLPQRYSSGFDSEENQVLRNQAAAPPAYLVLLTSLPIFLATYISSTRYSDFKHHGWDIFFGGLIGFFIAWGTFRWYHAPIRRGAGWSWGPRSAERGFWKGVGVEGWGEEGMNTGIHSGMNGTLSNHRAGDDVELGHGVGTGTGTGTGLAGHHNHGGITGVNGLGHSDPLGNDGLRNDNLRNDGLATSNSAFRAEGV